MFRACYAGVPRPPGLTFAARLVRPARPHKKLPLLLARLIFIYYAEICGCVCKHSRNGPPESKSRGKPWIGGFWLRKVFRGGARGAREGCTRRSARVFRAHNSPYGSNETSKITVFKDPLKKCSAKVHAVLKCKQLNYQIYCIIVLRYYNIRIL